MASYHSSWLLKSCSFGSFTLFFSRNSVVHSSPWCGLLVYLRTKAYWTRNFSRESHFIHLSLAFPAPRVPPELGGLWSVWETISIVVTVGLTTTIVSLKEGSMYIGTSNKLRREGWDFWDSQTMKFSQVTSFEVEWQKVLLGMLAMNWPWPRRIHWCSLWWSKMQEKQKFSALRMVLLV